GVAALLAPLLSLYAAGGWREERGVNLFDGGAPFYDVYATADGRWVAVGALEDEFFAALVEGLGLDPGWRVWRADRARWPELRGRFAGVFKTRTLDEWCAMMEGSDVCFAPVLSLDEAPEHPHNRARSTFVTVDGVTQPAPAPRFSRSRPGIPRPPARRGEHTDEALRDWGFSDAEIAELRRAGACGG
ncbi:MAG TPA: CoA transferase, partial [Solirubrobacterales bacterium]|nr:CoA transferase [Solirubrobacterales bacterium]